MSQICYPKSHSFWKLLSSKSILKIMALSDLLQLYSCLSFRHLLSNCAKKNKNLRQIFFSVSLTSENLWTSSQLHIPSRNVNALTIHARETCSFTINLTWLTLYLHSVDIMMPLHLLYKIWYLILVSLLSIKHGYSVRCLLIQFSIESE